MTGETKRCQAELRKLNRNRHPHGAATLNALGLAFMAVVNGNRTAKLLIFGYGVELSDRALFVDTDSNGRDKDTAFAAYEELGGAMRKPIFDETIFPGDPDG